MTSATRRARFQLILIAPIFALLTAAAHAQPPAPAADAVHAQALVDAFFRICVRNHSHADIAAAAREVDPDATHQRPAWARNIPEPEGTPQDLDLHVAGRDASLVYFEDTCKLGAQVPAAEQLLRAFDAYANKMPTLESRSFPTPRPATMVLHRRLDGTTPGDVARKVELTVWVDPEDDGAAYVWMERADPMPPNAPTSMDDYAPSEIVAPPPPPPRSKPD